MNPEARRVQRTFLALTLGMTLSTSLIWGINTLFLLDAGLSNTEAFAANAFFTAGMVLFEVPTGVADTRGRRVSYLIGSCVLALATLGYVAMWWSGSPFWARALVSVSIGPGYTFFTGASEAWLVDALRAVGGADHLEHVFSHAQVVGGGAMLVGSVAGGLLAQVTSLGVPFVVRAVLLLCTGPVAAVRMKDVGFTPSRPTSVRRAVAELAAAALAAAQVVGGLLGPRVRRRVERRTTVLIAGAVLSSALLAALGTARHFLAAVILLIVWGPVAAAVAPVRQVYLNDLVPSASRATVLSFDSRVGNVGGGVLQPGLGCVADAAGYAHSLVVGAGVQLLALPFLVASRRTGAAADQRTASLTGSSMAAPTESAAP